MPGDKNLAESVASVLAEEEECVGQVKVGKQNIFIPRGTSKMVKTKVHTRVLGTPQPVIFSPDIEQQWDDGLEISETLLTVKQGSCSTVSVPVKNSSNRDIVLKKGTYLGSLQPVQAVITLATC